MTKNLTEQSRQFRLKARELGRAAMREREVEKALPLVHQALSWIQLAENEEVLRADGLEVELRPSADRTN